MAGHSQFKNIMHRKGAQDKKRAKLFNKHARIITVAAKSGLPDPEHNVKLRNAIIAARIANMPNSRIDAAIAQGNPNNADASNYEDVRYEGYGPGGVAIIIEALTDNRNRTAAEVRLAFTKSSCSLGESNSVSFMFAKIGHIVYGVETATFDAMFEAAVEGGAENVESIKDMLEVSTKPEDFAGVRESLVKKFGEPKESGIIWKPNIVTPINFEQAEELFSLIEALEDNDDVQHVFANFEVDEETMQKLAS